MAQSRPDQRGSGDSPKTAFKIALSKSIISATVGEAAGSGSYKSREEPRFQQDASCNDLSLTGGFVIASGSSMKQTPQVSSRGVRCRAQWVWNTNAHSLRIHTVRVLRLISWIQIGQNAYIALPCTNRCGEPSSQSIDLRIHSIGKRWETGLSSFVLGLSPLGSCSLVDSTLLNDGELAWPWVSLWTSLKANSA